MTTEEKRIAQEMLRTEMRVKEAQLAIAEEWLEQARNAFKAAQWKCDCLGRAARDILARADRLDSDKEIITEHDK